MQTWSKLFSEAAASSRNQFHRAKNGDVMVKLFGIEGYWFFCEGNKSSFLERLKD